jgi:hypothetical protein
LFILVSAIHKILSNLLGFPWREETIMTDLSGVFNHTDKQLTRVGLGGEGVLRTTGMHEQADQVIRPSFQKRTRRNSKTLYADSGTTGLLPGRCVQQTRPVNSCVFFR